MERPIVLVSACLEFEKVRYNGQVMPSKIVVDLKSYVTFIKVCPEFEIGLGVPREPIRIVKVGEELRLIQHNTNKDVTDEMNAFSERFIAGIDKIDGCIFKSRSPSMGVKGIKVYSGMKGAPVVGRCNGFFAGHVMRSFTGYPIEEEERLRNHRIRDQFLTVLFLMARYREARAGSLQAFHQANRLLFMYYDMNRAEALDWRSDQYLESIQAITRRPPGTDDIVAFYHRLIGDHEVLERYRQNKVSLDAVKEITRQLVPESEQKSQTFFEPYPQELIADVLDDRNRDYWK